MNMNLNTRSTIRDRTTTSDRKEYHLRPDGLHTLSDRKEHHLRPKGTPSKTWLPPHPSDSPLYAMPPCPRVPSPLEWRALKSRQTAAAASLMAAAAGRAAGSPAVSSTSTAVSATFRSCVYSRLATRTRWACSAWPNIRLQSNTVNNTILNFFITILENDKTILTFYTTISPGHSKT